MRYRSTVIVPQDMQLGDFADLMEKLREQAGAEVAEKGKEGVPISVVMEFEEDDAWDLFLVCKETEDRVKSYLGVDITIPKPEEVKE